jgi:hypothetical protein
MQMDRSDEHSEKANGSIEDRLEGDSNATVERDRHPKKHCAPSLLTVDGIQIDNNGRPENARFSIDESLDGDS